MTSDSSQGVRRKIVVLAGPTGVGKTERSLELAGRLRAEIVSADSRQVYRELTIGTAKPTPEERAAVPHHFIDERSIAAPISAGAFAEEAYERFEAILGRGHVPLVVGGSTLYLAALMHGLADVPPVPEAVRRQLAGRLQAEGPMRLFAELESVDPASAGRLDPSKTQRLLRALEVYYATGRPLSDYHRRPRPIPYQFAPFVLTRPRPDLYERINRRVDAMLEAGLIDEVRGLLDAGVDTAAPPLRTIGYREPIAWLRGDIPTYAEMVRLLKRNSRRYAKRQLTWFRRFPSYTWVDLTGDVPVDFFLLQ